MKFTTPLTAAAALVFAAALAGCSSAAPEDNSPAGNTTTEPPGSSSDSSPDTSGAGTFAFDHVTSCEQLDPYLAPWIDGLVDSHINDISASGVHCAWVSPAEETDLDRIRSVEVRLVPTPVKPDFSVLAGMKGYESLSDPWVDEHNGEAYALTFDIGLSAVIGTTIWVPGVEATVSGGKWADLPPLDQTAGLEVAKELLTTFKK